MLFFGTVIRSEDILFSGSHKVRGHFIFWNSHKVRRHVIVWKS
jgi:hypothetical protein